MARIREERPALARWQHQNRPPDRLRRRLPHLRQRTGDRWDWGKWRALFAGHGSGKGGAGGAVSVKLMTMVYPRYEGTPIRCSIYPLYPSTRAFAKACWASFFLPRNLRA